MDKKRSKYEYTCNNLYSHCTFEKLSNKIHI